MLHHKWLQRSMTKPHSLNRSAAGCRSQSHSGIQSNRGCTDPNSICARLEQLKRLPVTFSAPPLRRTTYPPAPVSLVRIHHLVLPECKEGRASIQKGQENGENLCPQFIIFWGLNCNAGYIQFIAMYVKLLYDPENVRDSSGLTSVPF